jgi:hypothetical protein
MANPIITKLSDSWRAPVERDGVRQAGQDVAVSTGEGLERRPCVKEDDETEFSTSERDCFLAINMWPARPGEEQHKWESPRICDDLGTLRRKTRYTQAESGMGGSINGMADLLHPQARNAALRILGNAWVPHIPYLIFRWMMLQSKGILDETYRRIPTNR